MDRLIKITWPFFKFEKKKTLEQPAMVKMPEPKNMLPQYLRFSVEKVKCNPNLGY